MNNTVKVDLGKDSYDIIFSDNFVESIKNFVKKSSSKCMLITQKEIFFPDTIRSEQMSTLESLPNLEIHFIGQGEEAKSMESAMNICKKMSEMQFDRSSTIFAVGGGVVGDVAGFAASIFMRGIKYMQYPTTLLAMIDSSIGGKTGVNLESGKNLIGRIHQPKAVIIDLSFLLTLPKIQFQSSLAEALKYGFIYDRNLFDFLVEEFSGMEYWLDYTPMTDSGLRKDEEIKLKKIIFRCCEIKSEVVSKDVDEKEHRMILNFGHTIGHALEAYYDYKMLHGDAIVYGMICALYISRKVGILSNEDYIKGLSGLFRLRTLISFTDFRVDFVDNNSFLGISTTVPEMTKEDYDKEKLISWYSRDFNKIEKKKLIEFIKRDKKFKGGKTRFILISEIGEANISSEITLDLIEESLKSIKIQNDMYWDFENNKTEFLKKT